MREEEMGEEEMGEEETRYRRREERGGRREDGGGGFLAFVSRVELIQLVRTRVENVPRDDVLPAERNGHLAGIEGMRVGDGHLDVRDWERAVLDVVRLEH
jgi:hypothetical protein